MKKTTVVITFFLFLTASCLSQTMELQTVDSIVNSKLQEDDPAVMVGIVKDGEIMYEKYRGLANLQHQVKAFPKTRSNIASTAKQFTALMILQLSLEQKLSLEDDIRKFLPSLYPEVKEEIKIRHLLNHTSGIRDYVELMSLKDQVWWTQVGLDNNDVLALIEKQQELAFKPGCQYTYSNTGYVILAEIVATTSGEKFADYSEKFFQKLGMTETTFARRYMGVIPNRAEPYSDWGDGVWLESPTVTKTQGEGFLFTTLKDQLIFEQAVQNATKNNNKLLITSQQPIPNSEITSYGFGLELDDWGNRKAVHHDGATAGYNSQMVRFPEERLTIFIMSNNGNLNSKTIANEIVNVLLPVKEALETSYDSRFTALDRSTDTQVIGQYRSLHGSLIRVVEKEGKTYWKRDNRYPIELTSETPNTFYTSYNPSIKINFYDREAMIFYPSGKVDTYNRSDERPATFSDLESFVGNYYSEELEMSFELKLTADNHLKTVFSTDIRERELEALNRNELLADDMVIKVQRDQFDRVTGILMSYGRAKNNRFKKKTNLQFQPKIDAENGSIQVTTIGGRKRDPSNILLTKNYENGNEIWSKQFGGKSYDKASSILATEDGGYLIIGSTSSYGNGNYDMFVIKTNNDGKKVWQKTYSDFYNEYGYSAEKTESGYLIKGTVQHCSSNTDVFDRECTTHVWFVRIDKDGNEIDSQVLEQIN